MSRGVGSVRTPLRLRLRARVADLLTARLHNVEAPAFGLSDCSRHGYFIPLLSRFLKMAFLGTDKHP